MATARLVSGSTIVGTLRPLTLVLVSLAWAFAAARLCTPAAHGLIGSERAPLLVGILVGGPGSGPQPLAFWASLLLWWRGVMLGDWQPNLDEALMRLWLVITVGGAAVGMSAAETNGAGLVQLEQALGSALLLGLALLTTTLGRRQEMAGWIRPARSQYPTAAPRASARLVGLTVGLGALAVLALVGLGTTLLSRDALAPVLNLAWTGLSTLIVGLLGVIRDLSSLLPQLPDPGAGLAQPAPVDRASDGSALNPPAWTGLLGLTVIVLGLVALVALPVLTDRQHRRSALIHGLQSVGGGAGEAWPEVAGAGPGVVLAMVLRLFRGMLHLPGRRHRARPSRRARSRAAPAEPPSIRAYYRAYLRWAARGGCTRLTGETPDELLERLTRRFPAAAADSALLTTLYADHRYGGRPVPTVQLRQAEQALGRLLETKPPDPPSLPVRSKLSHRS